MFSVKLYRAKLGQKQISAPRMWQPNPIVEAREVKAQIKTREYFWSTFILILFLSIQIRCINIIEWSIVLSCSLLPFRISHLHKAHPPVNKICPAHKPKPNAAQTQTDWKCSSKNGARNLTCKKWFKQNTWLLIHVQVMFTNKISYLPF